VPSAAARGSDAALIESIGHFPQRHGACTADRLDDRQQSGPSTHRRSRFEHCAPVLRLLDISRAARHVRKLVDATDLDYV
jgi:hypothetical protein